MFNTNMFLLLSNARPIESYDYHDGTFLVEYPKGVKKKLADYFLQKARKRWEIERVGTIIHTDDKDHYTIYFDVME